MNRTAETLALALLLTGAAHAQSQSGSQRETTFVLKVFADIDEPKLRSALKDLPEVSGVEIDAKKRLVTVKWTKADLAEVTKLEETCGKCGHGATFYNPMRVGFTMESGNLKDAVEACRKVKGVQKMDVYKIGAICWSDPATIELEALTKAAESAKASIFISSHESIELAYYNKGSSDMATVLAYLDRTGGVLRIAADEKEGVVRAIAARGWNARQVLAERAKKFDVTIYEKKK